MNKITQLKTLKAVCLSCTACPLCEGDSRVSSPHVFGRGNVNAPLIVVGQNPGFNEAQQKKPFIGISGKNFDEFLAAHLGLERKQIYITNTVKCFTTGNRAPRPHEVATCKHFLEKEIEIIQPDILLALGNTALQYLTGKTGMTKVHGQVIHSEQFGVDVFPMYHPSPLNMNKPTLRTATAEDFQKLKQYLDDKASL